MKTPIVKLLPTAVALKVRGTWQSGAGNFRGGVTVVLVRQTAPVRAACAVCVEMGMAKRDPSSSSVTATSRFIERSLLFLASGVYGFIEDARSGNSRYRWRLDGQD